MVIGCFNEAPAERGGKLRMSRHTSTIVTLASMRPPLNAGENKYLRAEGAVPNPRLQ